MQDNFTALYLQNFPSRKLTWYYNQGTVSLRYNKYILVVYPVQAAIILWLNKQEAPISIESLREITRMKKDELIAILDSLMKTGVNILDKNSKDEISLKPKIESKKLLIKFKLPQIKKKKTKVIRKNMEMNRGYLLDATIVRIMKSSKLLTHNKLIQIIIEQTKNFTPEISLIKRRIESLIDRDYLERENENTSYRYIA